MSLAPLVEIGKRNRFVLGIDDDCFAITATVWIANKRNAAHKLRIHNDARRRSKLHCLLAFHFNTP